MHRTTKSSRLHLYDTKGTMIRKEVLVKDRTELLLAVNQLTLVC